MTHELKEDHARTAIIEQAAGWFLRHRSGRLTHSEKEEFLEWLRASRLNTEEYVEQVRLHRALGQVVCDLRLDATELAKQDRAPVSANLFPLAANTTTSDPPPASRYGRRRSVFVALAASVAIAIAAAWIYSVHKGPQRIAVPHGEQRIVQLPDGSTMHVNVSSRVDIKYTDRERAIELKEGQAFFEVARDSERPFRVRVKGAEVMAVGTQFDVYLRRDREVIVTVVEGKVDIVDVVPDDRLRLSAGQQVRLGHQGRRLSARPTDTRVATAWMRREVIFNGEPLEQVAEELNRYIPVPVNIEDENLKKMRVRAVFNVYDSDSFLAFLKQYGVELDSSPTSIRVYRR
jgi:transmembrane sensor